MMFILVCLLIWTNFVVVGHIMALFSALGNLPLFMLLTISAAAAARPLLQRIASFPQVEPAVEEAREGKLTARSFLTLIVGLEVAGVYHGGKLTARRALMAFFLGTALLALVFNIAIAFSVHPSNPDTLAYRWPRVFFYLSQGSLSHFTDSIDPRLLYYPLNGVLLYAFMVYHGLSSWAFTLVSCLSWVVIGAAVYRTCLGFRISRLGAVATAWIVCFTPNVLAQATSTNDEIVAAAPLLVGVMLACIWLKTHRTSHLVLSAMAVGLSLGTKLHLYFYWPLFVVIGLGFGAAWVFCGNTFRVVVRPLLLPLAAACSIIGLISLPFAFYNYSQKGEIMHKGLAVAFSNKPFIMDVGLQNISLYGSQMLVSPVLDLNLDCSIDKRRACYSDLNGVLNKRFFSWVDQRPQFMAWSYRFQGVWSPISYYLSEETVWLGFTPLLFVLGFFCLPRAAADSRLLMGGLLVSFWAHIINYSMSTKYIETTGIYFAYSLIVASPGLAVLWFPAGSRLMACIKNGLITAVVVTHVIFAVNIYSSNAMRNLTPTFRQQQKQAGGGKVDKPIRTELRAAEKIRLVYTHWELSFYNLLRTARRASYTTAIVPAADDGKTLNIFSFEAAPGWGRIPVKLYDTPGKGLTYLGMYHSCFGLEYTFASGADVALRHPEDSGYIVLQVVVEKTPASFKVAISPAVQGAADEEKLLFRYTLASADATLSQTDWTSEAKAELSASVPLTEDLMLNVEVDLAGSGKISRVRFPLAGSQPVLEDKP
jgi:hypothetical protein